MSTVNATKSRKSPGDKTNQLRSLSYSLQETIRTSDRLDKARDTHVARRVDVLLNSKECKSEKEDVSIPAKAIKGKVVANSMRARVALALSELSSRATEKKFDMELSVEKRLNRLELLAATSSGDKQDAYLEEMENILDKI